IDVKIATVQAGSVRAARDFRLGAGNHGEGAAAPSPSEYLLAALTGCVMVTFVQGLSARGITIRKFELEASAVAPSPGSARPMSDVSYKVLLDTDAPDEMVAELTRFVSCFSPNHRTFVEPNVLLLEVRHATGPALVVERAFSADQMDPAGAGEPVRVNARWLHGAQLAGTVSRGNGPSIPIRLDQPKQYLGLDSAANPQEYLLSALATELLDLSSDVARSQNFAAPNQLACHGWLDMRGITNV